MDRQDGTRIRHRDRGAARASRERPVGMAFIDDPAMRQAHKAPVVKVMALASDDPPRFDRERPGSWPVSTYVLGSSYTTFAVWRQDRRYRLRDADGAMIRTPARMSITEPGRGVREVGLAMGLSAGRSLLFERRANCWILAEEPDAPTP